MSAMSERWTDREIDGLSAQFDHRFDRLEVTIRDLQAETKAGFARSNDELLDMRKEIHAGLESIGRTMVSAAVAIVVALITAPHL